MKKIQVIVTEDDKHAVSDWGVAAWYQDVLESREVVHIATVCMLDALRIGVLRKELEPFCLEFRGQTLHVDSTGQVSGWPNGFFDTFDKQLNTLLGWS